MIIQRRGELHKLFDEYSLPRTVVECGCAEGRFSQEIYNWGVDKLYLVDLWETMPFIEGCASFDQEWHNNNFVEILKFFGTKKNVTILKGFSHKMANEVEDESMGMVYLDAGHDYHSVKSDIASWWPKIIPGGIMSFHDYANYDYGVNRAVIEFVKGEQFVNRIEEDGKIENIGAWIRK